MILTNPPFGMKFTDKDSYSKTTWFNQAKIKNGNMVCLQYNMHILAPGGICSMVWPYGSECFSTSKKTEIEIRKRLFTEFDVLSVILLPKGTFEYTSIATVIITFRKPIQGEIIVPKLKIYQYKDGAKTVDELEILADVGSDKLREKKFVIDPNAYKEMINMNNIRPIFEIKKLGDICTIKHGNYNSGDMDNDGQIPFYNCSAKNPTGTHSRESFDEAEYLLLLSSGGSENNKTGDNVGLGNVYYVNGKSAFTGHVFSLTGIKEISVKYLYCYLKSMKNQISNMAYFTSNLGIITKSKLDEFLVPVPPMKIQNEIVSIVERFEVGILAMQESIKGIEFQIEMLSKKQFVFKEGEFETKKLGDICSVKSGAFITKNNINIGKYPVIGGGVDPLGHHSEFNTPANTILISRIGAAGYVSMYNIETFVTDNCLIITTLNVCNNFIFYYLKHVAQNHIYSMQNGVAQQVITSTGIRDISIPIPTIDVQKQIADRFDILHENMNRMKNMMHESEEFAKREIQELFR
jgi:type I restriction enzyme S subunit